MKGLRVLAAAMLSVSLVSIPASAGTSPTVAPLGDVIPADRGHVGQSLAGVGTTVYSGDRLSTETQGSIQVSAGAARVLLLGSTIATGSDEEGKPSGKLLIGTPHFL